MTDEQTIESIREHVSQTLTEINALTWAIGALAYSSSNKDGDAQAMHLRRRRSS